MLDTFASSQPPDTSDTEGDRDKGGDSTAGGASRRSESEERVAYTPGGGFDFSAVGGAEGREGGSGGVGGWEGGLPVYAKTFLAECVSVNVLGQVDAWSVASR